LSQHGRFYNKVHIYSGRASAEEEIKAGGRKKIKIYKLVPAGHIAEITNRRIQIVEYDFNAHSKKAENDDKATHRARRGRQKAPQDVRE
jgi:hypothetical protein